MASCIQLEKTEGYSCGTDILKGGWRTVARERGHKEESNVILASLCLPIYSVNT